MSVLSSLHPQLEKIGLWLLGDAMELFRKDFASLTGGMKRKEDGTDAGDLDFAIADSCRRELGRHLGVITEEDEPLIWPPRDGSPTILLDPLDGTHNHAFGSLDYGAMVVLCEEGSVTTAAILLPAREEISKDGLYIAARGQGTYRYDSRANRLCRLHVSAHPDLATASLFFHGKSRAQETSPERRRVAKAALRHRNQISSAWSGALIAQANLCPSPAHGLLAVDNHPWDNLAPALLIEEAGGMVTDFHGQPWTLVTRDLVAANPTLHAAILAAMRNSKE